MKALHRHFSGKGNETRNLAEAQRLNELLHYKSKRAISFEIFLTQCQKMFNIYEKEGEEMSEEAKVQLLFRKVQHTRIRSPIDALKASQKMGTAISYTIAAKHFSTANSELLEYIAKNAINVSGIQAGNGTKGCDVIYNGDGSINTGHIPSWKSLPFKDRELIIDEWKRLGIKLKGKSGAK